MMVFWILFSFGVLLCLAGTYLLTKKIDHRFFAAKSKWLRLTLITLTSMAVFLVLVILAVIGTNMVYPLSR